MELTLNMPALLFPAVSLLLLAYTNRFLALSNVIRNLYKDYQNKPDEKILRQIANLRKRLLLIRGMQTVGISSLLLCTLCMLLIFLGIGPLARLIFGASLCLMLASLALSLTEIRMQGNALTILLTDMEAELRRHEAG